MPISSRNKTARSFLHFMYYALHSQLFSDKPLEAEETVIGSSINSKEMFLASANPIDSLALRAENDVQLKNIPLFDLS